MVLSGHISDCWTVPVDVDSEASLVLNLGLLMRDLLQDLWSHLQRYTLLEVKSLLALTDYCTRALPGMPTSCRAMLWPNGTDESIRGQGFASL